MCRRGVREILGVCPHSPFTPFSLSPSCSLTFTLDTLILQQSTSVSNSETSDSESVSTQPKSHRQTLAFSPSLYLATTLTWQLIAIKTTKWLLLFVYTWVHFSFEKMCPWESQDTVWSLINIECWIFIPDLVAMDLLCVNCSWNLDLVWGTGK